MKTKDMRNLSNIFIFIGNAIRRLFSTSTEQVDSKPKTLSQIDAVTSVIDENKNDNRLRRLAGKFIDAHSMEDLAEITGMRQSKLESWLTSQTRLTDLQTNRLGILGSKFPFKIKKSGSPAGFTFIDLFAGIGGLRLPFQQSGGDCVFSSEWDSPAKRTYYENFGEYP